MVIECFDGKRCEVDVEAWVRTQLDQRPGEDIEALARKAGVPPHRARASGRARRGLGAEQLIAEI
jgi:hypothetical protein